MNRSNIGAVRLSFLTAAVLAILAVPASAQVVERGRTWDDLVASHPCASGLTGRIARVTDCDAADDVGDGGGAFQCWVSCDGSAPWVTQAIGAGGGGLPGADEVTESMLKAVDAAGDEECLTFESTVGDFEWQTCATGNILGAPLTATDDLAICTDGTGGSTIGACAVLNIDNLRLDANTISSTDTNGNINLTPNGTGQVLFTGDDTATTPTIALGGTGTGISGHSSGNYLQFVSSGVVRAWFLNSSFALQGSTAINGSGGGELTGMKWQVQQSTAGSGAPNAVSITNSLYVFTNEGSTAENYHTLPTAVSGLTYTFVVQDADGIRITAAAGDTIRPIAGTAASAAAGFIRCATQGAFITLIAVNATEWISLGSAGVWTIDI